MLFKGSFNKKIDILENSDIDYQNKSLKYIY